MIVRIGLRLLLQLLLLPFLIFVDLVVGIDDQVDSVGSASSHGVEVRLLDGAALE